MYSVSENATGQTVNDCNLGTVEQLIDILSKLENQINKKYQIGDDTTEYEKVKVAVFDKLNKELDKAKNKRIVVDIAKLDTLNSLSCWKYYSEDLQVDFIDSRI